MHLNFDQNPDSPLIIVTHIHYFFDCKLIKQ